MNDTERPSTKRPYRGGVRRERAERTRERILEALIRTMARGVAELSVPAVAREAGVSVPTVYRHFRSKRELVEALPAYFVRRMGGAPVRPPRSLEELAASLRALYAHADGMDETLMAAALSELGDEVRRVALPARRRMIDAALGPEADSLDPAERARLRDAVLVLGTSAVIRAFHDYLGISVAEAAEYAAWTIRMLGRAAGLPPDVESG